MWRREALLCFRITPVYLWYGLRPRSNLTASHFFFHRFNVAPISRNIKASTLVNFEAQYIPSIVAVYASRKHLCSLCKTRFRWLTRPCRTGLLTCRVISKCFIIIAFILSAFINPHFTDLSQRDLLLTSYLLLPYFCLPKKTSIEAERGSRKQQEIGRLVMVFNRIRIFNTMAICCGSY